MPMRQFAGVGNCHLLYLKKQKQKKQTYKLPASRGALFIMFCLCSVVPAAFSAPPISPGNIVINAHLHVPAYAVPTPLTAFPSSACPTACSWAPSGLTDCLLHLGTRAGCVHYSSVTITHRVRCRTQFQQKDL